MWRGSKNEAGRVYTLGGVLGSGLKAVYVASGTQAEAGSKLPLEVLVEAMRVEDLTLGDRRRCGLHHRTAPPR